VSSQTPWVGLRRAFVLVAVRPAIEYSLYVFTSNLFSTLADRYAIILHIAAASLKRSAVSPGSIPASAPQKEKIAIMAVLTISREFGSGGREIGRQVVKELGYEYLNRNRFFKEVATQGGKWEQWGKGFDEHSPSVWEKYDWSFRGFGALARSILLDYAVKDNAVLMERGGNFLLKGVPHVFRIRVIAPLEARLDRVMIRESVDYDTARWLIERTDHERSQFIRALFGKDWGDPEEFDVVFNTGIQPVDEIVHAVCETLRHRDALKTDEVQQELRLHAQAAKLEAGLFTYPYLFVNTLEVTVEKGTLVLRGIVRNPKQKKRVEEIAAEMAADVPLKFGLHYRME
jgi:cytidylate kinase